MTTQTAQQQFGFKFGRNGVHASRTMMLTEITELFAALPETAAPEQYQQDIVQFNILHKPTEKSRQLTWRHLFDLYGMNNSIPLFRVFRRLWDSDADARKLMACQIGLARDPLLYISKEKILSLEPGQPLPREQMEQFFSERCPDRYSPATLRSIAQNVNGTWTSAGYLRGHVKKTRSEPVVRPVNVAFALFLSYLQGASGSRLFASEWSRMLEYPADRLQELARFASQSGLINYKHSSEVIEITFPDYLTREEESWLHE
jgi:hypothetical protein